MVENDVLAVLVLDDAGNANDEAEPFVAAARRRSLDRVVDVGAADAFAGLVFEIEQGEVGVLPVVLFQFDGNFMAGGVDQRRRGDVEPGVVELRRLSAGSEPGDVAAAFDRLIARRKRKAYRDLLPFAAIDLSRRLRAANGRETGDDGRKSSECAHDSSPVGTIFEMFLGCTRSRRVSAAARQSTRAQIKREGNGDEGSKTRQPTANALS